MSVNSAHHTVESQDIRGALQQAEKPLTSAELGKLFGPKSGKGFKTALGAEVSAGRIFAWGANLYWDRDPKVVARERLLNLAQSEVVSADVLVKRAAATPPKIKLLAVRNARKELISEKRLREVASPPLSKIKAKWNVNVQHPEPYLEIEIGRLLVDFGIERSAERIRGFLALEQPQPEPDPKLAVSEVAEKMFAAMNRMAFSPGATVTFHRLRQQPELAGISKAVFDEAALLLQRDRRALLAVHGHAPSLPKEEQDELVADGFGAYYVYIYAL